MSSKAVMCPKCGFTAGEVTAEQLDIFRARRLRDRIYHLSMISYAVMTVFVGGFGWYWWDSAGFQNRSSAGPFILMGLSAVAYLAVRALLFRNRQKHKELRKKGH